MHWVVRYFTSSCRMMTVRCRAVRSLRKWSRVLTLKSRRISFSSLAAPELALELEKRGLVEHSTRLGATPPPPGCGVYVGFDPTASSLHVGHLLSILTLLHFQKHGYQPIVVLGGATGLVGDPSGRSKEREEFPVEALERNMSGLRENLQQVFTNEATRVGEGHEKTLPLKIFDNAEWWRDVTATEFVNRISRHFRISAMLTKESVKQRMDTEDGMSCAEFLYPIFQGYDFLQLHQRANCWLQFGGGDQWGNIQTGVDYVRKVTGKSVHGLTSPLLTTSSGEKLGKSAGNAVWLCPQRTSPYSLYQYFVRTPDQDVQRLLSRFTFLSTLEITEIIQEHLKNPSQFVAQRHLAESVTRLVHGETGLDSARRATAVLFGDKEALGKLSGTELEQLFEDAPSHEISFDRGSGKRLVEVMAEAGVFASLGEVESMVRKGGLYVNFERLLSIDEVFDNTRHLLSGNTTHIRIGKKQHRLIKWK